MEKFKLNKSTDGRYMLEHHEYPRFIITFPKNQFNEKQEVKEIDNFNEAFKENFMGLPRLMRQAGDWLSENHNNIL